MDSSIPSIYLIDLIRSFRSLKAKDKMKRLLLGWRLHTQAIALRDRDSLEIYHTPGHSPDSISMRIGSLKFLGDLFFAPNPGMAGAYGWSQHDLMQSILKILWILEN